MTRDSDQRFDKILKWAIEINMEMFKQQIPEVKLNLTDAEVADFKKKWNKEMK